MRCAFVFFGIVGSLVAVGCGGGGSGGGGGGNPLVRVRFPAPVCNTETETLHVRGVSTGLSPITAVTVGGVPATSLDGFQTFSANVPLTFGLNQVAVVATDGQGQQDPDAPVLRITRSVQVGPVTSMDYDPATNRLLMLDPSPRLVIKDLANGQVRILSGVGVGSGVAFENPRHVVFDTGHGRAIVSDQGVDDLIAVDLSTGNRSKITNTFFNSPDALALDAAGNRVLVTETTIDAVVAVDLTTGTRTTLSDDATGTGTGFELPASIVYEASSDTAYVLDLSLHTIFAVDLGTGNRTVLADDVTGTGTTLDSSTEIARDPFADRLVLTRAGFHRIYAVSLSTGDRTDLMSETGNGPSLDYPRHVVVTGADRAILGQGGRPPLLTVDFATDTRATLHDWHLGTGPALETASAVGFDFQHGRYLVANDFGDALIAVNAGNGNRSIFLEGMQPAGGFGRPQRLEVDPALGVVHVYGESPIQVARVNLQNASMSVVARLPDVGMGESFQFSRDVRYDAGGGRYFASIGGSVNGILQIDALTGDRSIFADASTGSGLSVTTALQMAFDPVGGRLYFTLNNGSDLIGVADVATGVRTAVSVSGDPGPTTGGADDIRLDAARNRIVAFAGLGADVIAVDIATGTRTELSGPTVGGGLLGFFAKVGDLRADLDLAIVTDYVYDSLVLVDLTTGDRVTVSR